jgi:hypothetical protein
MTDTNKPAENQSPTNPPAKGPGAPMTPPPTPPTIEGKAMPPKPAEPNPAEPKVSAAKPDETRAAPPPPNSPASARPIPPVPPKPPVPPASAPSPAATAAPKHAPERSTGTPIWLTGIAVVLLAGGIYWVWHDRSRAESPTVQALQNELRTAQQRIAALEQRPLPPAPDTARIAALENAVKALANKPAEKPVDTSALEQRLAALENKPAPVIPDVAHDVQTAIAGANAEFNAKIASLDTKLQQDLARTTRLRAATAALDAGKPIGDLPGASAAVQRYATVAPPTEPALRQSFSTFATAAEKASQPTGEGQDFATRMWGRAQQLVTVRQGDKVLVGAPAAVTLAAARSKLDAGDLAGAVAALAPLDPPAAAAMAPWKRDAQALLDARAGLAAMAAKS